MRKKTILYVDDETQNLITFQVSLEKWYNVIVADNGKEALEILSKEEINVLVTDQRMPEMTGLQLAEIVKSEYPAIIIIILTAYDDPEYILEAINTGNIFRYILKPWKIDDLLQILNYAFENNQLRKNNINLLNNLIKKNKQLEKSEYKYRTLVENTQDLIYTIDSSGKVVFISKNTSYFGIDYREIINHQFDEFVFENDKEFVRNSIKYSLKTKEKQNIDFRMINKKEHIFYVEIKSNVIKNDKNEIEIVGILRDISENVRNLELWHDAYLKIEELKQKLEEENIFLKKEYQQIDYKGEIVGQSKLVHAMYRQIEKVAKTVTTVLLLGETGTGKELVAKMIHQLSPRKDQLLVTINCAAIPENLMESELFGHEKGAFTGAFSQKYGKFEIANKSTLFFDEIGELPLYMQPKLLRVLQEKEFERIGGNKPINIDVRIIAATNRDLEKEIKSGNFREDLFYRLNIFPILVPPLRERKEDIPLLVNHILKKLFLKTGKEVSKVSQTILDKLMEYDWPGNIRELENIIERAHILSQGNKLDIGTWFKPKETNNNGDHKILSLEETEKEHILSVLKQTKWRVRGNGGASEILKINPTTLESRMKKLNINRPY